MILYQKAFLFFWLYRSLSFGALFLVFFVIGCTYEDVSFDSSLSLEVPQGYARASKVPKENWEDVAKGAYEMALSGDTLAYNSYTADHLSSQNGLQDLNDSNELNRDSYKIVDKTLNRVSPGIKKIKRHHYANIKLQARNIKKVSLSAKKKQNKVIATAMVR